MGVSFKPLAAAFFYGISSIVIISSNKILLTQFAFPSVTILSMCQCFATCSTLYMLKLFNVVQIPMLSKSLFRRVFPVSMIFLLNVIAGLSATKSLNLPMFTVLRRFSIWFTIMGQSYYLGSKSSNKVKLSVGLMILGALVAASNDLAFDPRGYALVLFNDVTTAMYGVYIKGQLSGDKSVGRIPLLFYNSMFSFPLLGFLLVTAQGKQLDTFLNYGGWDEAGLPFILFLSIMMGVVLNYSIILNTSINSALTTTIVGCIKNVLIAYLGVLGIVGGDYIFSWANCIGLNISIGGGLYYSYIKYAEMNKPAPPPSKPVN